MEKIWRNVTLKHWKSCTKIILKIKKITDNFWEHMEIFEKMLRNLCESYRKLFLFFFKLYLGNVFEKILADI